jgi:rhodanese-related sulfurtransferase
MALPPDIDPATAAKRLKDKDFVLIDVREPAESDEERIEGAVLMPLSTFNPQVVVDKYGDKDVAIHCLGGGRSARAAAAVTAAGKPASNVTGGINAWKAAGLPTKTGPQR